MVEIRSINDHDTYVSTVGNAIADEMTEAIAQRGVAHLVLTGGTIGIAILAGIPLDSVDWTRVHIWWGDERFVPAMSPDRNCVQAENALLTAVDARGGHLHRMPASDSGLSLDQAVADE